MPGDEDFLLLASVIEDGLRGARACLTALDGYPTSVELCRVEDKLREAEMWLAAAVERRALSHGDGFLDEDRIETTARRIRKLRWGKKAE